ncbi:MAG: hypothetical protein DRG50_06280 [Deltaproteobacteria bacterium]|nr:MAG: hypothetical protein DRG50_06280 [Deltaproteobacteria bacterium]
MKLGFFVAGLCLTNKKTKNIFLVPFWMIEMVDTKEAIKPKRQEALAEIRHLNKTMLSLALEMAREVKASGILIFAELMDDINGLKELSAAEIKVILASSRDEDMDELSQISNDIIHVPPIDFNRSGQVKVSIMLGLSRGLIHNGDRLICLSGSQRYRVLDSLVLIDVGREFEIFASRDLGILKDIARPEVFESLLSLALELGREGREGKPVGTTFVLGDHERVMQFSRQMVINPFGGVPEEERNIMDSRLKESIKEFSAIDGAFVIREDGVVLAAGRHLDASGKDLALPQGLGSRHMAAAGITSITNAIAIVVSESTGDVRIFNKGKIFMDIEKGGGEV